LTLSIAVPPPKESSPVAFPTTLDFSIVRSIPTQHDGRYPPLDTVARDIVREVTGSIFPEGRDPVVLLLAWTFDSQAWMREPLIGIRNAELRQELQLPADKTVFSYWELAGHERLHELIDGLAHIGGDRKPNPLESKVSDISTQLMTLQRAFAGDVIHLLPVADDRSGTWTSVSAIVRAPETVPEAVRTAWEELRMAFTSSDSPMFTAASEKLKSALAAMPAAYRPDPKIIAKELRYNTLRPYRTAWMAMVAATVLAALALAVRRKWFDVIAVLALVGSFGLLTYGLSLRWSIAGRIPASNMFESLLFLSWGMGAFAILSMLIFRQRLVPLTAAFMGTVSLVLADCLPMDQFIRPIAPVLMDTIWMSIHVPIIMVSYSVLALGVLIAHVQLATMAAAPRHQRLSHSVDMLHYWYIHVGSILLLAGIVTGSMWAASSWGRYWGWDPKEVWSLVAFLAYLAILHVRIDHERVPAWAYVVGAAGTLALFAIVTTRLTPLTAGKIVGLAGALIGTAIFVVVRGRFGTAFKSVVAFWLIIMTYVGVNYVLGIGLHSYGFGTGAVVRYMFLVGGTDLAFVVLCALIYYARSARVTLPTDDVRVPVVA